MTTQELTQKIADSDLSDSAKRIIMETISGFPEITPELEDRVRELIQDDIDDGFAQLGIDDSIPEIRDAHDRLTEDLAGAESDLDRDMGLLAEDVSDLDAMAKELSGHEDRQEISDLKHQLENR